jgi:streptomycin 6-kinase
VQKGLFDHRGSRASANAVAVRSAVILSWLVVPRPSVPIPAALRQTVVAWFGAAGQAWLDSLPSTVERLARDWRLRLGPLLAGGSASLVLAVTRHDGTAAVLKVPLPDDENRHEADALRHYGGVGAVLLYGHDPASGALLLERLMPGASLAAHADQTELLAIACRVIRRLWRPPGPAHPFGSVRALAIEWAETFAAWHARHGRPFPPRVIGRAEELARAMTRADEDEVVVNRDAHAGNILSARREPWLLIDPKPLVGEPAFDAGYLLLDRLGAAPDVARAGQLVETIADALCVRPARVRAWAFLRAVENTLWCLDIGASPQIDLAKAIALMGGEDRDVLDQ